MTLKHFLGFIVGIGILFLSTFEGFGSFSTRGYFILAVIFFGIDLLLWYMFRRTHPEFARGIFWGGMVLPVLAIVFLGVLLIRAFVGGGIPFS